MRFDRLAHYSYRSAILAVFLLLPALLSLPSAAGSGLAAPTQNLSTQAAGYDARFGFTVTAHPGVQALDAELALLGGEQSWYSYDPDQPASAQPAPNSLNRPSVPQPSRHSKEPVRASASATTHRVYQVRTGDYYALAEGAPAIAKLQSFVDAAPGGSYWLVGNEPNVIGQDDASPQEYATQYETIKNIIRQVDPTAKMVGGNFMNWNTTCLGCNGFPRGDNWMPQMMAAYQSQYGHEIDFNVWGFHTYNINWDKSPMVDYGHDINQISTFRAYLNTLPNQAAKPIWLTEFGVIWGYDGVNYYKDANGNWRSAPVGTLHTAEMHDYLNNYMDWLLSNAEAKNIQRWFLFTNVGEPDTYSDAYGGISLFTDNTTSAQLTDFGLLYKEKSQPTALAAPSQPNLQLVTVSNRSNAKLSWGDNTSGETGFYVERRIGTVGNWSRIATLGPNTTTYQDNNIDLTKIYYYRVQALNDSTRSHYSMEASYLPPLGTLQLNSVSASQVKLSWTNPAAYSGSALNFIVEYRVGLGGNWTKLATLPPGATTYTHNSPASDTLYFYRVRTSNNLVSSAYTNLVSAVTPGPAEVTVTEPNDNGQSNILHSLSYALNWAKTHSSKTVIIALPSGQNTIAFQSGQPLPTIPPGITIAGSCGSNGPKYTLDFSNASSKALGLSLQNGVNLYGVAIKGTGIKVTGSQNWLYCASVRPGNT